MGTAALTEASGTLCPSRHCDRCRALGASCGQVKRSGGDWKTLGMTAAKPAETLPFSAIKGEMAVERVRVFDWAGALRSAPSSNGPKA